MLDTAGDGNFSSEEALSRLPAILAANPSVDWRGFSFAEPSALAALDWAGYDAEQVALTLALQGYQRLLRLLAPEQDQRVLPLLRAGIHSAIQIANFPQDEFARRWAALFPGEDAVGKAIHRSALSRRSALLLHHVNDFQHQEPHYRAARFR
jgi:hypothetical protein